MILEPSPCGNRYHALVALQNTVFVEVQRSLSIRVHTYSHPHGQFGGSACDENWMMDAGLHHSPSSIVQRRWSGVSKPALKSVSRLTSETKELLGPGLFGDLEAWTHSTSDVTRETREKV